MTALLLWDVSSGVRQPITKRFAQNHLGPDGLGNTTKSGNWQWDSDCRETASRHGKEQILTVKIKVGMPQELQWLWRL